MGGVGVPQSVIQPAAQQHGQGVGQRIEIGCGRLRLRGFPEFHQLGNLQFLAVQSTENGQALLQPVLWKSGENHHPASQTVALRKQGRQHIENGRVAGNQLGIFCADGHRRPDLPGKGRRLKRLIQLFQHRPDIRPALHDVLPEQVSLQKLQQLRLLCSVDPQMGQQAVHILSGRLPAAVEDILKIRAVQSCRPGQRSMGNAALLHQFFKICAETGHSTASFGKISDTRFDTGCLYHHFTLKYIYMQQMFTKLGEEQEGCDNA